MSLQWRQNGHNSISNHQPRHCLLSRLFRRRLKKISKLRVTGLCAGNSPGTGEFPAQMASYAENVSIWWRHHVEWGPSFYSSEINTLRPRQDGCHFPDDIFKWIFLNEIIWIAIKISLKFVPSGPINNIPTLVQIMAWRRPGDKPLSEPMMVSFLMHICVSRPQWEREIEFIGLFGVHIVHISQVIITYTLE